MNKSMYAMNHSPRNQRDLAPSAALSDADVSRIRADVERASMDAQKFYAKRIAAEISAYNREASAKYLEALEDEKAAIIASDPRTPDQIDRDLHDAECHATNESARP